MFLAWFLLQKKLCGRCGRKSAATFMLRAWFAKSVGVFTRRFCMVAALRGRIAAQYNVLGTRMQTQLSLLLIKYWHKKRAQDEFTIFALRPSCGRKCHALRKCAALHLSFAV